MVVTCPQCRQSLNVPDTAVGQQGRCPMCRHVFTIAPPGPVGAAAPAAPVAPAPVIAGVPPPPGASRLHMKFVAMGGALLMVVSFFLPWWGASFTRTVPNGARQIQKSWDEADEFAQTVKDDKQFHEDAWTDKQKNEQKNKFVQPDDRPQPGDTIKWSGSAFGWRFASGIMSFIFGLVLMALIVPQLFVKVLQRWGWTGLLPGAAMALVVFILALVFWIACPGKGYPGTFFRFSQGSSVGPFLALGGALAAAGMCAVDGILGLTAFVRRR